MVYNTNDYVDSVMESTQEHYEFYNSKASQYYQLNELAKKCATLHDKYMSLLDNCSNVRPHEHDYVKVIVFWRIFDVVDEIWNERVPGDICIDDYIPPPLQTELNNL